MLRSISLFILLIIPILCACTRTHTDFSSRSDVQQFIQQMTKKHYFTQRELVSLFSQVQLQPEVVRHIKKPLEKQSWHRYQSLLVNAWRIQNGIKFWNQYEAALHRAEKIYGIPPSIIIATLGIETRYGERMGNYRVIDSLSNLAFNHAPRAPFFRRELEEFLLLTRENHFNPLTIKGSYAGAIGQPQFIPSSYRHYAVNFSHSGHIDLIHSEIDAIGSVANYYRQMGWITGGPIVSSVNLTAPKKNLAQLKNKKMTLAEWKKYGIHGRKNLPLSAKARLIELDSPDSKEYWLGLHNFEVIKRYNASDLYAMAVLQLSRYIDDKRKSIRHE